MQGIKLSDQEKAAVIDKIQLYFQKELDQEIGQFDADFLLDFFAKEIGVYFYNQGLFDAQQVIDERIETIKDALYEIEQPISSSR